MTREERLSFCKICKNQKLDFKQGIVCGLTNAPAEFENSCDSFSEDITLKNEALFQEFENIHETVGKGTRLANYLLDLIFIYILGYLIGLMIGPLLVNFAPDLIYSTNTGKILLFEYLLGAFINMIYYVSFEASSGRTIGKYITKTKVVTLDGEKPDFNVILIRSLCRLIPFEGFSFLGDDDSGWHDTFSKTKVVKA
ncbi:RDD family protein [Tenacibaculum sp. ZS6-P6]|uniref:RDD family protein n=1 Tax=Tenacibaculum sp. ZS6-P6 TaxID=3447503 RepID=UPI003F9A3683